MRALIMAIAFVFALIQPASAAVYQQGIVYVIYDEEGDAAVKNNEDLNTNGVPDVVEDIATQVNAARELFNDVFQFPDPLESEHYKNVTSIEVDIYAKEVMRKNGMAFSTIRKKAKHNPEEQAFHIRIANTLNPKKNSSPAHEYFHLIQFGATYFRNGWFLEGMARWSEDSVVKIKDYPDGASLSFKLKSKLYANQLYQEKYKAAKMFWYPVAIGMKDKVTIPASLINKYKYVNGESVFRDDVIYGPNVMLKIIREMQAKEEVAAANFGSMEDWRKNGRRDDKNNDVIMNCVREVYDSK